MGLYSHYGYFKQTDEVYIMKKVRLCSLVLASALLTACGAGGAGGSGGGGSTAINDNGTVTSGGSISGGTSTFQKPLVCLVIKPR